jgi:CubicO group peptidase (beta-lactamase class C family)
MKTLIGLLSGAAVTLSAPAMAQDAAGDWVGTLQVTESVKLPLVVHIKQDDGGALSGTMDSPTQGAIGMPLAEIAVSAGQLTFKLPALGGAYQGRWDAATKAWNGEWSQAGMTWPLALAAPPPPAPLPTNWTIPADGEISGLIAARIAPRKGEGLVVGVLEPAGRRVVAGGPEGGDTVSGSTVYEIGSISKVFTALILADMVAKGQVSLDDPAEKYLPAGARMPARNGRKITLRDLSTHVSGLPRLPDNMPFGDPGDPYADYSEALMLEFLAHYELPRDIGAKSEYSNFAVGLLGYLLGRAAHSDYETLLRERITGPLGMNDTSVTLAPGQQARFAPGHDEYMRPAKPWTLPTLMGAGGIRSTADDMLKFAAAVLDPKSPIAPAMTIALADPLETDNPRLEQGLGWQVVHPEPGRTVLMHNGGTGGYRSALVLEPSKGTAVVVLANSAAEPSATDLAVHLLVGSPVAPTPPIPPAPAPQVARAEIALPAAELDRVVGRYNFGAGVEFEVVRDGATLKAQRLGVPGAPALPIYAEAPLSFFWKAVDAQLRFTTDASGGVTGAEFVQGEAKLRGTRVAP